MTRWLVARFGFIGLFGRLGRGNWNRSGTMPGECSPVSYCKLRNEAKRSLIHWAQSKETNFSHFPPPPESRSPISHLRAINFRGSSKFHMHAHLSTSCTLTFLRHNLQTSSTLFHTHTKTSHTYSAHTQKFYVHRIPSLHNTKTNNPIHIQINPLFLLFSIKHGKRLL